MLNLQYNGFLLGILLWSIIAAREVHYAVTEIVASCSSLCPASESSLHYSRPLCRPLEFQAHFHLYGTTILCVPTQAPLFPGRQYVDLSVPDR